MRPTKSTLRVQQGQTMPKVQEKPGLRGEGQQSAPKGTPFEEGFQQEPAVSLPGM